MIAPDASSRIVLFQVKEPKTKLHHLAATARSHFEKKEHFLIVVEDDKSLEFVDELLWKFPPTSFLPHAIAAEETDELIAITKVKKNLNHARYAFNLCATPLLIEGPFRIIYDFEDLSSPGKQQLSALRYSAYKNQKLLIEARSSPTT
jgi:DNA polymerase IIIc chi subunit